MSGNARDRVLSLLSAANNHGDLAVKLSSLKQAKNILLSVDPSLVAEIFPYFAELQFSPERLIRKSLVEVVEEVNMKAMAHSSVLIRALLSLLKDNDSTVTRQAIISGTNIFCNVLEELWLQVNRRGFVERWLEELWTWMIKFKDAVFSLLWEGSSVGTKLLALKHLETYILLFTPDTIDSKRSTLEATKRKNFNISWMMGGHGQTILDPAALTSDASKLVGILLDMMQSASRLPGPLAILVTNCLASIGRKRPLHYNAILSRMLELNQNLDTVKGGHIASFQYSLRSAFLGFLRCTYPSILESRERLIRALRGMNAGEAADQVIRQVEKLMRNNERAIRDARPAKEDQLTNQMLSGGNVVWKRPLPTENEEPDRVSGVDSKRIRHNSHTQAMPPRQTNGCMQDSVSNGVSQNSPPVGTGNPVEQMITMIVALIAEGDRGVESLELIVSQMHPELMADIIMANMRHLPDVSPPLSRNYNTPLTQNGIQTLSALASTAIGSTNSLTTPVLSTQIVEPLSSVISTSSSGIQNSANFTTEPRRDPRREPRRLDPRRAAAAAAAAAAPADILPKPVKDVATPIRLDSTPSVPVVIDPEVFPMPMDFKVEADVPILENTAAFGGGQSISNTEIFSSQLIKDIVPVISPNVDSSTKSPHVDETEDEVMQQTSLDMVSDDDSLDISLMQPNLISPSDTSMSIVEEPHRDLPPLPPYVELTEEQQKNIQSLAVERILRSYTGLQRTNCSQTALVLLAQLFAQIGTQDEIIILMQKHVVSDYQSQKGYNLGIHILYHLHTLTVSDPSGQSSVAAEIYEKFLNGLARSLLDTLPANDKSFSRLLGEVPFLSEGLLKLLNDLCTCSYQSSSSLHDGDRVTQGLGAVWSLILSRPPNRQACLNIALKCAVHSQDEIRTKAIRLVTNKLYVLSYITEDIERFATDMFFSAIDKHFSVLESCQENCPESKPDKEQGEKVTSVSASQCSEPGKSVKGEQPDSESESSDSVAEANRLISLFFALCTKKPSLIEILFKNYSRATKAVKQVVHRLVPVLVRTLGSSCSELLHIVSDPPEGSENLLIHVLQILSEGSQISPDLIGTVKRLYETKIKDASILIPVLSSFTKDEVLPIIPSLVDLPLEKFQEALAHILQGSAHSGPALTPAEVLVAIHDITPEKGNLPLKKITDACTACFEQRTVFTQQVLAKALNQMVDQSPLPFLFMRTIIQAINAFPALVDIVMEILSKLIARQIWRLPKLWVGFLKCVSQTQPHSFPVLLQLPVSPLENALNKYSNLRAPLVSYANQPAVKNSIPRPTLVLLGLLNESQLEQAVGSSEGSSSVRGSVADENVGFPLKS